MFEHEHLNILLSHVFLHSILNYVFHFYEHGIVSIALVSDVQ